MVRIGCRPARLLGEAADFHLAPLGQQQGAGYGRRGHHQHVGPLALAAEQQALLDAETVLLVDHRQAEVAVVDRRPGTARGCRRRCGMLPSARPRSTLSPRRGPSPSRSASATGTGREARQGAVVLLCQHLGRRHQRGLGAGLDGAQHRQQAPPASCRSRHRPAAGAASGAARPGRRRSRPAPGDWDGVGREAEAAQRLGRAACRRRSASGRAAPAAGLQPGERRPVGEQLVIGQAAAARRARARGRGGRVSAPPQGVGETGPALAAQQGRVVPFRQLRETRSVRRAMARPSTWR